MSLWINDKYDIGTKLFCKKDLYYYDTICRKRRRVFFLRKGYCYKIVSKGKYNIDVKFDDIIREFNILIPFYDSYHFYVDERNPDNYFDTILEYRRKKLIKINAI